uniref:Ciliary microtubule inner protein 2A-C-like domain-containing protein n=1 Tax=Hemiselmis andersenii TaxID=464988 RepID=A0A6U5B688_HEMAN|mmetsp:Transcript_33324/g.78045  ORF Transcript_33324/g.78045 Transcript_33324/m.78045 type:complete len:347 (+) Transcript_33324:244-1284(+)
MSMDWMKEGPEGNARLIQELKRRRAAMQTAGGGRPELEPLERNLDTSFTSQQSQEDWERSDKFMQAMETRLPNSIPWGIDRKYFKFEKLPTLAPATTNYIPSPEGNSRIVPQLIPGYTGHVGKLKHSIGNTYGNATARMLGRVSPAFVPMHEGLETNQPFTLQRTGYPTFQHTPWQRSRPDTANRKAMRDPILRELSVDIVQRISNQLISRVGGKTRYPMNKVVLDVKRACDEVFHPRIGLNTGAHPNADSGAELTEEQAKRAFALLRIEMLDKDIHQLFRQLSRPTDMGRLRVDVLCAALEHKQAEHPLVRDPMAKRGVSQNNLSRPTTQASTFRPKTPWAQDDS